MCKNSLAQGGFFCKDGNYYCTVDYQNQFGTKCAICGDYVEGEVVSALGNTYHQKCFTCARCRWVWVLVDVKEDSSLSWLRKLKIQQVYI